MDTNDLSRFHEGNPASQPSTRKELNRRARVGDAPNFARNRPNFTSEPSGKEASLRERVSNAVLLERVLPPYRPPNGSGREGGFALILSAIGVVISLFATLGAKDGGKDVLFVAVVGWALTFVFGLFGIFAKFRQSELRARYDDLYFKAKQLAERLLTEPQRAETRANEEELARMTAKLLSMAQM